MKFGVTTFLTDETIDPVRLAREVEARGFESLWLPEHTHIPADRRSPWPGGAELPRMYTRTYDPFVALAMAAAATTTLKVGTGVCLVVERDPITTAKEVASIDRLSGGRFLFGIGGGWNREEMQNHGTDPTTRWTLLRERIEAMKAIWADDEASYAGQFVQFDRIWAWPKPLQQPHPPIVIGGDGTKTLERVLAYGDEWMPIAGRNPEPLGVRVTRLQELAAEAGRAPIPVGVFNVPGDPAVIEQHRADGATRCVFARSTASRRSSTPSADDAARLRTRRTGARRSTGAPEARRSRPRRSGCAGRWRAHALAA
jgi:probable F420-dependent oxidoreductase